MSFPSVLAGYRIKHQLTQTRDSVTFTSCINDGIKGKCKGDIRNWRLCPFLLPTWFPCLFPARCKGASIKGRSESDHPQRRTTYITLSKLELNRLVLLSSASLPVGSSALTSDRAWTRTFCGSRQAIILMPVILFRRD